VEVNYRIRALQTGTATLEAGLTKTYAMLEAGQLVRYPQFIFYVESDDGSEKLLFEAGMPEAAEADKLMGCGAYGPFPPCEGGGPESMERALGDIGIKTGDIQRLVVSHLHVDHGWNIDVFPDAQLIVQRDEIIAAIDPTPHLRFVNSRKINMAVVSRKKPKQLMIIDGDRQIGEGLSLIKTPGHTRGGQTLIVQTEKGRVALCGQNPPGYANWFPADSRLGQAFPALRDTYNVDPVREESAATYLGSMEKIASQSDIYMMTHEFRIPKMVPEQWWFAPPDKLCAVDWNKAAFKYGIIDDGIE
jgi:glyoxylase-like metal-dependent hydrolase (beta-lactamase superfamily II)